MAATATPPQLIEINDIDASSLDDHRLLVWNEQKKELSLNIPKYEKYDFLLIIQQTQCPFCGILKDIIMALYRRGQLNRYTHILFMSSSVVLNNYASLQNHFDINSTPFMIYATNRLSGVHFQLVIRLDLMTNYSEPTVMTQLTVGRERYMAAVQQHKKFGGGGGGVGVSPMKQPPPQQQSRFRLNGNITPRILPLHGTSPSYDDHMRLRENARYITNNMQKYFLND